jgi:hypothetical protein
MGELVLEHLLLQVEILQYLGILLQPVAEQEPRKALAVVVHLVVVVAVVTDTRKAVIILLVQVHLVKEITVE